MEETKVDDSNRSDREIYTEVTRHLIERGETEVFDNEGELIALAKYWFDKILEIQLWWDCCEQVGSEWRTHVYGRGRLKMICKRLGEKKFSATRAEAFEAFRIKKGMEAAKWIAFRKDEVFPESV